MIYDTFRKLREWINIPESWVKPVLSVTWGCGSVEKPKLTSLKFGFFKNRTKSLYYNGIVFVRVMWPFYIGVMVRWSGSSTKKAYVQAHLGWKLNGKFALTSRIQSDGTAAAGKTGPNYGQAKGWECGTK